MSIDVTVYLDRAVIQLASDPTVSVVCGTTGRGDAFAKEGEFRKYANGATRLILGTATTRSLPVTLRALYPGQVTRIKSMVGKTVLFRDTYGRRIWGSFLTTDTNDIPLSGTANVDLLTDIQITLQTVDYTEVV